jgi:hypothetical protein
VRLKLEAAGHMWFAEVIRPELVDVLQGCLPFSVRAVQSEWSGDVTDLLDGPDLGLPAGERGVPFQFPGQLVYDPSSHLYALCFGEGRLQDGFGPLSAVPIATIQTGLAELLSFGRSLQFVGVQTVTLSNAIDESVGEPEPNEGRLMRVSLGTSSAQAVLLERSSPNSATALARLLPLRGTASNTYASGPLTRFWNEDGGAEGATTLDSDGPGRPDPRRSVAAPGFIYYMPTAPHNGLRISARSATVMKSALPGGDRSCLIPVARFVGDWARFTEAATQLRFTGALPMNLELSD